MPEFKLNGKTYSGSTNYASAISYTEEDGSKTTVQDKISEQNKKITLIFDTVTINMTNVNTWYDVAYPEGFSKDNCIIVGATIKVGSEKYIFPGFGQSLYNLQTIRCTDNGIGAYISVDSYVNSVLTVAIARPN